MKKYILAIVAVLVLVILVWWLLPTTQAPQDETGESRQNSTSTENPTNSFGTMEGTVLLGPSCPTVQFPPQPGCEDKPYKTLIQVIQVGSPNSVPFKAVATDNNGYFKITLPAGSYTLQPEGGAPLPNCKPQNITVIENENQTINLSCDSGIR